MKKTAAKIISIILVIIMCVPLLLQCVLADNSSRSDIPVVYVEGQGYWLYNYVNTPESTRIYPIDVDKDYITAKAKQYLPVFAKAVLTQKWDDFCDALYESFVPLYKNVILDKNGEARNGSGVDWSWSKETVTDTRAADGTYGISDYLFRYDWRLDPVDNAKLLSEYIEAVKAATGYKKVALIGRCLGAAIVSSYLTFYGADSIDSCILYCGSHMGAASCSKPFTCELFLMDDAIERYVSENDFTADAYVNELIKASVTMLNKDGTLAFAAAAINNVYPHIALDINPRIIRESYGSYASYWSMMPPEDYEKAKEAVFYGTDISEYAGLISKIDNYHYNVQLKLSETLPALQAKGLKLAVIAKYGKQMIPVTSNFDELSDDTVNLSHSSMGATASDITGTISDEYIQKSKDNGTYKYISPDKQVDASTCLFKDNTWFIKNIIHRHFPESIDSLMYTIINSDTQMTVYDDSRYPQFMVYDDSSGAISPMTADNCNTADYGKITFLQSKINFIKAFFAFLKNYIQTLTAKQQ